MPNVFDVLLMVVFAVVLPLWSHFVSWPRHARAVDAGDPRARSRVYVRTIVEEWLLVVAAVAISVAGRLAGLGGLRGARRLPGAGVRADEDDRRQARGAPQASREAPTAARADPTHGGRVPAVRAARRDRRHLRGVPVPRLPGLGAGVLDGRDPRRDREHDRVRLGPR